MGIIANIVNNESNKKISSKTLRKWYNEFDEYGKFKEDFRGCYERNFFLTEYGYKRRFELYLKNERQLSVAAATTICMKHAHLSLKSFIVSSASCESVLLETLAFSYLQPHFSIHLCTVLLLFEFDVGTLKDISLT